jgi:hypothetical protein
VSTKSLVIVALFLGLPAVALAQTAEVPRTPWGHPDLQGIWGAGYILTPLERPDEFDGREFLTDEEVAAIEGGAEGPGRDARATTGTKADVEGAYNDAYSGRGREVIRTRRTSLIIDPPDGKIPFTSEGRARVQAEADFADEIRDRAYNPEDQKDDRCEGITLPLTYGSARISGGHKRIVQSPEAVSFYYESGHQGGQYRDVPLDGRAHPAPHIRQWFGHSVGRWEGDTLVVEVSNFSEKTSFHGSHENLHLVERFTRIEPDLLMYQVTIEDPTTFSQPWTIEVPLQLLDNKSNQIYESACQEGNYSMVGILAGERALEAVGRSSRDIK